MINSQRKESNPCIKEAMLYEKVENKIRCKTCEHFCLIGPEKTGLCKTRINYNNKLYTMIYGDISSLSVNPIEKKPFYHFFPGSKALTVGSWSCNFNCDWCQNFSISKYAPDTEKSVFLPPKEFIFLMKQRKCQGTSISFNEPTLLLEYSLDVFKLAKREGYYNTYVSNGYMSQEALRILIENGLDAINFDVKGTKEMVQKYCKANMDKIWRNIEEAKNKGIWVEITTLIIPKLNDSEKILKQIASKIKNIAGENTPWHITRYHPAYKFLKNKVSLDKTSIDVLENAWLIGKQQGLNYVYVGNVPGHPYANTYCPNCNDLLIKRDIFDITDNRLKTNNVCEKCGNKIELINN
jgi:pyruvate formate lyase activating enzyme